MSGACEVDTAASILDALDLGEELGADVAELLEDDEERSELRIAA